MHIHDCINSSRVTPGFPFLHGSVLRMFELLCKNHISFLQFIVPRLLSVYYCSLWPVNARCEADRKSRHGSILRDDYPSAWALTEAAPICCSVDTCKTLVLLSFLFCPCCYSFFTFFVPPFSIEISFFLYFHFPDFKRVSVCFGISIAYSCHSGIQSVSLRCSSVAKEIVFWFTVGDAISAGTGPGCAGCF